jgi:WhiB family transcriptional regulator, redox-sensing transcriptional regulator
MTKRKDLMWRADAECYGEELVLFFPDTSEKEWQQKARTAKRICRSCGVRMQCLQFAVDTKSTGIFGGLSERERKELL